MSDTTETPFEAPRDPSDRVSAEDGVSRFRLLEAHDARRRLAAARAWIADLGPRPALVVTPTRGAADDLLRGVSGTGLLGVERLTLRQLAADLSIRPMAEAGLLPVGGLALEALAARAVAEVAARRNPDENGNSAAGLEYFAPVSDAPGFPRALLRTLDELRSFGMASERLRTLGPAGRDLARLATAFEALLEREKLLDPVRLLRLARQQLEAGVGDGEARGGSDGHRLSGLPVLLLDLSPASPAEEGLLTALVAQSPGALGTVIAGDTEGRARLERILGRDAEPTGAVPDPAASTLDRFRHHIFEPGPAADPPSSHTEEEAADEVGGPPGDTAGENTGGQYTAGGDSAGEGTLSFFSAPGEGRECV
ncbi:MAG: hypothetical protein MI919_32425, partial [Holophagales bacterium]|nr:hypothetical protein [Holophagales bacterium]